MATGGESTKKFLSLGTKSIQRTDQFLVTIKPTFNQPVGASIDFLKLKEKLDEATGLQPTIDHWHVRNLVLPSLNFNREIFKRGSYIKSFASLEYQGFQLSMTLEDDDIGTLPRFVNWCQRRIIDDRGFHLFESLNRVGTIQVDILDHQNLVTAQYNFEDCYYLTSDPVSFDYSQASQTLWNITFGCDFLSYKDNVSLRFEREEEDRKRLEREGLQ